MIRRSILTACAALSLCTAVSFADRPLTVNDPRTIDTGDWLINAALNIDLGPGNYRMVQAPLVEANYGLQDNLQLRLQGAFGFLDTTTIDNDFRLDDIMAGVKWRFLENGPGGFDFSFFPQLGTSHHFNEEDKVVFGGDRHSETIDLTLPVQAGRQIDDWYVFGEAGLVFRRSADDRFFIAAGAEREIDPRWTLMGDLQLDLMNGAMLTAEFGARYELNADVNLIGSIARTFGDNDVDQSSLRLYVGAQWQLE